MVGLVLTGALVTRSLYYYPGNMKVSSIYLHGSYQAEPARYLPCLDSRPGSQEERPAFHHLVPSAVQVHADTFNKATCLSQANNKPFHSKLLSFYLARFPGPQSTFYLALLVLISAFKGKRKISEFGIPVADLLSSSSAFRFALPKVYIVWHRPSLTLVDDRDYTSHKALARLQHLSGMYACRLQPSYNQPAQ
jgi:hypothetical protein